MDAGTAQALHAQEHDLQTGRLGGIGPADIRAAVSVDISIWYALLTKVFKETLEVTTATMITFGMGASSMALFARVGGGIFTKAADVGADLVGKVEAGIPEDDPRNPAAIADNVGDNVGDVAGMGADLYESYVGSILSTCALGVVAFNNIPGIKSINAVALPLVMAAIGVICSLIGSFLVKTKENATQKALLSALSRGTNFAAIVTAVLSLLAVLWLLPGHFGIYIAILAGLIAGVAIGKVTEYYTSDTYKPTQNLSESSKTGTATLIISGLSLGMMSTLPMGQAFSHFPQETHFSLSSARRRMLTFWNRA